MPRCAVITAWLLLSASGAFAQPGTAPPLHPYTIDDFATLRSANPVAIAPDGRTVLYRVDSGGETARLLFCRIMLQKPNVLVLDEPTNHLDLESINALNIALQKYEGTVFLVTHDEDLMEEVGTRVWHFDGKTIHDFKGTYEEYTASIA